MKDEEEEDTFVDEAIPEENDTVFVGKSKPERPNPFTELEKKTRTPVTTDLDPTPLLTDKRLEMRRQKMQTQSTRSKK